MWARLLSAALGAWLMAAPAVLGYGGAAGVGDHVVGPIIVGSTLVAAWPVLRPLRWLGVVAGAWLLAAPWIFGYYGTVAMENASVVGTLLAALALLGAQRESVGSAGDGEAFSRERATRDERGRRASRLLRPMRTDPRPPSPLPEGGSACPKITPLILP